MDVARLESIAAQLAGRVRDDDPEANRRWLYAQTTPEEREALLYVLAAAVPMDVQWSVLTSWVGSEWCGTPRGPHHHRKAGEPVCWSCKAAVAKRERELRKVRAQKRAAPESSVDAA